MPSHRPFDSTVGSSRGARCPLPAPRWLGVFVAALALGGTGCEGCAGIQDITPTGSGGGGTGGAGTGAQGGAVAGGQGGAGGAALACVPDGVEPGVDCSEILSGEDALEIGALFESDYTCAHVGFLLQADVPYPQGGLAFSPDDPSTLLVVGGAGQQDAGLYTVGVLRDDDCHIAALTGGQKIAGVEYARGVTVGPGGALFFSLGHFPFGEEEVVTGLARMETGKTTPDEVVNLEDLGVTQVAAGIGFLPDGSPGAGGLAITTQPLATEIDPGVWYSVELGGGGVGPLDVLGVTERTTFADPVSFVFVRAGSPKFQKDAVLVTEYLPRAIYAHDVDPDGAPGVTKGPLLTVPPNAGPQDSPLSPSGTVIDPVTGDLLVVLLEQEMVVAVRGFAPPPAR